MPSSTPGRTRRALAAILAVAAAVIWTHALAGALRALAGVPFDALAPASLGLTLAAAAAALVGGALGASASRAATRAAVGAAVAGLAGALALVAIHGTTAAVPALAVPIAAAGACALGAWFATRLPEAWDDAAPRRRFAWIALGAVALLQVGRLATYVSAPDSDWFLSTRHPFYAKHECLPAYVFGAELALRGDPNLYDAAHYPGLTRDAAPHSDVVGMAPEDPYQYPPQFLLLPALALGLTDDYGAIRSVWFGLNATLCIGALLVLASWVGGRAGRVAGLMTPAVLFSFPALHDLQYGQFHFAAVALAVLGMVALQRERVRLGGALLASAILAKLFPALLLVPLAIRRRWSALGWTAAAGAAATLATLALVGTAPFTAFAVHHVPRLGDGSAFAFGEAWPEVSDLLVAGNQGARGVVHKLAALGLVDGGPEFARAASLGFAALLLAAAAAVGVFGRGASRHQRALQWLGLLSLGSLLSAGAWADYVPLTAVWALAFLAPLAGGRPWMQAALAISAVFQMFLIGAVPIGDAAAPGWMIPLSLVGALALFATSAGATVAGLRRSDATRRGPEPDPRLAPQPARVARRG